MKFCFKTCVAMKFVDDDDDDDDDDDCCQLEPNIDFLQAESRDHVP